MSNIKLVACSTRSERFILQKSLGQGTSAEVWVSCSFVYEKQKRMLTKTEGSISWRGGCIENIQAAIYKRE